MVNTIIAWVLFAFFGCGALVAFIAFALLSFVVLKKLYTGP